MMVWMEMEGNTADGEFRSLSKFRLHPLIHTQLEFDLAQDIAREVNKKTHRQEHQRVRN